jgi:hypothetical protein
MKFEVILFSLWNAIDFEVTSLPEITFYSTEINHPIGCWMEKPTWNNILGEFDCEFWL